MKLDRTVSWQWYPYGYVISEHIGASFAPGGLSVLTDGILRKLLPQQALVAGIVTDMRGAGSATDSPLLQHAPRTEELLYLAGGVFFSDSSNGSSDQNSKPAVMNPKTTPSKEFCVRLRTHFHAFQGAKHIEHRVILESDGSLEEFINPIDILPCLGRAIPIELSAVRLSIEIFEPTFLSYFGFAPTATQWVTIEATRQEVQVRMLREGAHRDDALPLVDTAYYQRMMELL